MKYLVGMKIWRTFALASLKTEHTRQAIFEEIYIQTEEVVQEAGAALAV